MTPEEIRAIELNIIEPLPDDLRGAARKEAERNIDRTMSRICPNLNEAKFLVLREIAAQLAEHNDLIRKFGLKVVVSDSVTGAREMFGIAAIVQQEMPKP